jgi:alanine-alpha-ketoisovalerate/valine-pyruvate aminotransferase
MFRLYQAIIRPYYKNRFNHFQYILESQIVYTDGIVVTMLYAIIYSIVKTDFKI